MLDHETGIFFFNKMFYITFDACVYASFIAL